jgi:hypothetical protein
LDIQDEGFTPGKRNACLHPLNDSALLSFSIVEQELEGRGAKLQGRYAEDFSNDNYPLRHPPLIQQTFLRNPIRRDLASFLPDPNSLNALFA